MEKYQPEGGYDPLTPDMQVIDSVAIIKVVPKTIHGKYKIGQHLSVSDRKELAEKILKRNSANSKNTLKTMGFEITDNMLRMVDEPVW